MLTRIYPLQLSLEVRFQIAKHQRFHKQFLACRRLFCQDIMCFNATNSTVTAINDRAILVRRLYCLVQEMAIYRP